MSSFTSSSNILIVGAGISGLSLAHYFTKHGCRIRLVEAANRVGGWIRTEQVDFGAGPVHFETGPRSLNRIRGRLTLELCDDLGLTDALRPASSISKQRYIIGRNRDLQSIPTSLWKMLQSDLTYRMPGWIIRDLIWPTPLPNHDLTMDEFFRTRLGPDAADMLASALAAGVFAGQSTKLSMRSCLPSLIQTTLQHKSLVRGLIHTSITNPSTTETQQKSQNWDKIQQRLGHAPMYSLDGGLSTLIKALERHHDRAGISIQTNLKISKLCPRTLSVETSDGQRDQFDQIFWTGSTGSLASVLVSNQDTDQIVRSLRSGLNRIHYASIACVTLIWTHELDMARGFGVLIPSCITNVPPVLGITFDSQTFPTQETQGKTILTVMMGGDRHPDLARSPPNVLIEIAERAARDLLGIVSEPDYRSVNVARDAIPQFYLGHGDIVDEIQSKISELHPGLHLLGTAISGVAINDCIRAAHDTCNRLYDHIPTSNNVFQVQS